MNRRWLLLAEIVSMALLAWTGYTLLQRMHAFLVVAVLLLSGGNAVLIWLLHSAPQKLLPIYARPLGKWYLDHLCRWTGLQPPATLRPGAGSGLLLHSDDDFRDAFLRGRQVVRGHDVTLRRMLEQIRDSTNLRQRQRQQGTRPPLATFLLVGPEGIGKRYLCRVIAKLLFPTGAAQVVACDTATPAELFGNPLSPGVLLEAVRQQPNQMIILERIEAASPDLIRSLQPLFSRGALISPSTGREISFSQTVVVLTTVRGVAALAALQQKDLSERAWRQQSAEAIASATGLEAGFVQGIGDVLYCPPPSDEVKSEVTALLMLKECQSHGLTLVRVDPPLIAAEVLRMDEAEGFSRLPQSVSQLLRQPLLAASRQPKTHLSLRVRTRPRPPSGSLQP